MEKVKTVFDMEDMYGLDILGLGGDYWVCDGLKVEDFKVLKEA